MSRPYPEVPGVTHRLVDAAGLRMHVAEAGTGEPLLLLHGWPQHWFMWRRQIPPLSERYHLVVPDLRGFGWTDAPARGYEKENLATDVLDLLDALGRPEALGAQDGILRLPKPKVAGSRPVVRFCTESRCAP